MFKRVTAVLSAAALAASIAAPMSASADNSKTAAEIVKEMGIGINLGNTFEATYNKDGTVNGYETGWGSVTITKEIIDGYAAEGFESIRIPVAWSNLMANDGNYTINAEYMARVKQVVEWSLDAGLYVVLNEHWDYGWIKDYPNDQENVMNKYKAIWTQVADEFKDYDEHLIFESQNEELGDWDLYNRWSKQENVENGKALTYQYITDFNQAFVDIVRDSGGNNGDRVLLISGYCTDIDATCDELFTMPTDTVENKLAVSVHYYSPNDFALSSGDGSAKEWGTPGEYASLISAMNKLKTRFVDQGVPVIIGEACNGTKLHEKAANDEYETEGNEYMVNTCEEAYARGMCPMLWDITYADNGSAGEEADNQIYNRRTQTMTSELLKNRLNAIIENDTKIGEITSDKEVTIKYGDPVNLGIASNSGGALKIAVPKIGPLVEDENGEIYTTKTGSANVTVLVESTSTYSAATASVKVTVVNGDIPATAPEAEMEVANEVASTDDIALAEDWEWEESTALEVGVPTKVTAVYKGSDKKYFDNASIEVTITRLDVAPVDPGNSSEEPGDSVVDPANTTNSDTLTSSKDDSKGGNSSNNSSKNDSSKSNNGTTTTTTKSGDASPATGAGAGLTGIAVVLMGAALVVNKKRK